MVIERQYARYFVLDVDDVLRKETESSRAHNIDAEEVMGMFSAAKVRSPNATIDFLSSKMRAKKNNTVAYLDSLEEEGAIGDVVSRKGKKTASVEEEKREGSLK